MEDHTTTTMAVKEEGHDGQLTIKVKEPIDDNIDDGDGDGDAVADGDNTGGGARGGDKIASVPAQHFDPARPTHGGEHVDDGDDYDDAATDFTTETLNRQWSTGTNSDERRKQRKWLLNFINKYVPADVDEGDAFVVVKVLVEAEILTAEQVEKDQQRAKGTQRFMSYFEELTDAEWDPTGRITSLYLGYKDLRDCPWELHPDISRLSKLKHLTIGWCVGLPVELSQLKELETLKLTMNVDEMQYEMAASEPPSVELVSLRELDAKATPGAVGFNLPSWISNSSFPNLEVLTLEDEPTSTYSDIVNVLKSLKRNKAKGHPGLRQLSVTNFEIGCNFGNFLLTTLPDNTPHLESLKFQDGQPYLTSVTDVASSIDTGDISKAFTYSARHLTTLDLQETELFGHRGGGCLIEDDTEHSALSHIVVAYEKLTVVGFTPKPRLGGPSMHAAKSDQNGKKGGKTTNQATKTLNKKENDSPTTELSSSCVGSSSKDMTMSKHEETARPTKKPRHISKSSQVSIDTAKATKGSTAKPNTVQSDYHKTIHGSGRRVDPNIGRRFAKYFSMQCDDEDDFEKLFFGTITKKIASETKPLQYRVEFDDGDTLDMEVPEIQEGLDLYLENESKDRKKGGTKRKA